MVEPESGVNHMKLGIPTCLVSKVQADGGGIMVLRICFLIYNETLSLNAPIYLGIVTKCFNL